MKCAASPMAWQIGKKVESEMSSILDKIFAAKRDELKEQRKAVSDVAIVARANNAPPPRDFIAALRARRPAIIAEIKRASPSKGDILAGSRSCRRSRATTRHAGRPRFRC